MSGCGSVYGGFDSSSEAKKPSMTIYYMDDYAIIMDRVCSCDVDDFLKGRNNTIIIDNKRTIARILKRISKAPKDTIVYINDTLYTLNSYCDEVVDDVIVSRPDEWEPVGTRKYRSDYVDTYFAAIINTKQGCDTLALGYQYQAPIQFNNIVFKDSPLFFIILGQIGKYDKEWLEKNRGYYEFNTSHFVLFSDQTGKEHNIL